MSDFVQQQNTVCEFSSSDSWVILSPIEQSIKRKIEAVVMKSLLTAKQRMNVNERLNLFDRFLGAVT